jgi:hypothetical protein
MLEWFAFVDTLAVLLKKQESPPSMCPKSALRGRETNVIAIRPITK